jgi:hypothetical protein
MGVTNRNLNHNVVQQNKFMSTFIVKSLWDLVYTLRQKGVGSHYAAYASAKQGRKIELPFAPVVKKSVDMWLS